MPKAPGAASNATPVALLHLNVPGIKSPDNNTISSCNKLIINVLPATPQTTSVLTTVIKPVK
jgi:hypothetical protein